MTKKRKIISVVIAISGVAIFTPYFVRADAPPPPPFTVQINFEGQKASDKEVYAALLTCEKNPGRENPFQNELSGEPLAKLNISQTDPANNCTWKSTALPYGAICRQGVCEFPGLTGNLKIAVFLPSLDKVFVSNSVDREYSGFYGHDTPTNYLVDLGKNGSAVLSSVSYLPDLPGGTTTPAGTDDNNGNNYASTAYNFWLMILASLIITLVLELFVALLFALIKKFSKLILVGVLIGNIISVPVLWLIVSRFYWTLFPMEILAVIFEAWLIKMFGQKKLTWKMCLLISLIMNLVSFIFGPFFYR
jgi:hypothetical protein